MSTSLARILKSLLNHTITLAAIGLFSLGMLQPHKFKVAYQPGSNDYVLAAYEDILSHSDDNDGSIAFESLIVGEDGNTKISYVVQAGDSLSDIAKNFGTTVGAITTANNIQNNLIRPGQRLTITYNEGIIYEVSEPTTISKFAHTYKLNPADLLTLNYMEDPETTLEPGTQLFIDLNKVEALERGLIEKKEYEMLNIQPQETVAQVAIQDETPPQPTERQNSKPKVEPEQGEQTVISAEETQQLLDQIETQSNCKDNQCAFNGECYTMPENARCAPESNDDAWVCQDGFEEKGKRCVAVPQEPESLCPDNQCELNGKCFSMPENARCAPESDDDAWVCQDGYEEKGKQCVATEKPLPPQPQENKPEVEKEDTPTPPVPKPQEAPTPQQENDIEPVIAQAPLETPKEKNEEIVSQWYFNPRKAGFPGYGWGAGHCTEYAAYYWWKHYNINLRDYIRGNAAQWYTNASNAGLQVGQLPVKGAIVVMKYGSSGWSSYGHVGVVTQVDMENRMIRIQDANFLGRFVVTDHWIDIDSTENPVIGYIYPNVE